MRAPLSLALFLLAPVQLTDADKLTAELHRNRVTVLQLQEKLATCEIQRETARLTEDQARLEQRFRDVLKPSAAAVWNWQSLQFDEPAK